jgi:hypothetical protein
MPCAQADLLARLAAEASPQPPGDSSHHIAALKQYLRSVNQAEAAADYELLRVTLEQTVGGARRGPAALGGAARQPGRRPAACRRMACARWRCWREGGCSCRTAQAG